MAGAFVDLFSRPRPIIGVIHLPALPGYPQSPGLEPVLEKALSDLSALEEGSADGVLVENEGDRPHTVEATRETIALMTRITRELVLASGGMPVGVEILLNDPQASLAVAKAAGGRFIRTDYFVDRMERPEYGGVMKIDPAGLMVYRARIGAEGVLILADIQVKYARLVERRTLAESARLARARRADAVIVTGRVTGEPPGLEEIREARSGSGDCPVLIGSGLNAKNAPALLALADGAIVGTSLKRGAGVDPGKVRQLVQVARSLEAGAG